MDIPFDQLIAHPLFTKAMQALLATLVIYLLVRFAKVVISRKIENKDLRYKMRKATGLAGCVFTLIAVVIIFSSQMNNLTVIIGALSVGICFARRELIQSLIRVVHHLLRRIVQARRAHSDRQRHGRRDRHQPGDHHVDGMRRIGQGGFVQWPPGAPVEQPGVQGKRHQLHRRFSLPVGRDRDSGENGCRWSIFQKKPNLRTA